MKTLDWFPMFQRKYLNSLRILSMEAHEERCYNRAILTMADREDCGLPKDTSRWHLLLKVTKEEWELARPVVLAMMVEHPTNPQLLTSEKLFEVRAASEERYENAKEWGRQAHKNKSSQGSLKAASRGPEGSQEAPTSYNRTGQDSRLQNTTEQEVGRTLARSRSPKAANATEPPPAPSEFSFPVVGKNNSDWFLPITTLAEFHSSYPSLDLATEFRKARAWCIANPAKRKTPRGMPAFLNRWIERAQNDLSRNGSNGHKPAPKTLTQNVVSQEDFIKDRTGGY